VEQQKLIKHSALASDGGFIQTSVTGMTNLSEGSIMYADASEIITELNVGSVGDSLIVSGSSLPSWGTAGGGGQWQNGGQDIQTSAVSSLSVSGITGADVYQVIYSVCDEATGSGENCYPCIRISNGGSTYDDTFAQIVPANQTDPPITSTTEDEWRLNKVSNGESWSGVIYIYAPNSNLSNGFTGTMMQHNNQSTAGNIATGYGENDQTDPITSVELFFRTAGDVVIDCVGSLQVNTMTY